MRKVFAWALLLLLVAVTAVAAASAAELPLTRVVLFSTGVGYFQHEGTVTDNATVPLSFRVEQINDILKSLVLQDLDGGTVAPVTYAPREPLSKALEAFSVNLGDNPSLSQLLLRLRGAEVSISGRQSARGLVLGVESKQVTVGETTQTVEYVNVLTEQGLMSLRLDEIRSVKLTDAKVNSELAQALGAIAGSRDVAKRVVDLNFTGRGKRRVSAGYLLETPVWKTTYRLVADSGKVYLQGWAIVENTTDSDWKNVEMALVSGRPVSFTQNLYEPLYAWRPDVPVALPVPVAPRIAEGTLYEEEKQLARAAAGAEMRRELAAEAPAIRGPAAPAAPGMGGGFGGRAMDRDALAAAGVTAAAAGEKVGELFQYQITQPVTIGRQKSAMIPIVSTEIQGEKVGLYNAASSAKHPLHALRLKNTSGLHLMGGAITVFDGGAYAGDALIEDLSKDEERLITYAVDLGTEVVTERSGTSEDVSFRLDSGVIIATRRNSQKTTYTLKNRSPEPRPVLIEQAKQPDWKLVQPEKPTEETASYYRFLVAVAPGATEKLEVKMEQPVVERVALLEGDPVPKITLYLRSTVISEEVKAALQEIIKRKAAIADVTAQREQKEARLKEIGEEQARIRQNMEQLDRESDLYKRYVEKLTQQEDEFDQTRLEITKLRDQEKQLSDDLANYIRGLKIG